MYEKHRDEKILEDNGEYNFTKLVDTERTQSDSDNKYGTGLFGSLFSKAHRHRGIGKARHGLIQDSYGYTLEEMEQFEFNATIQVFKIYCFFHVNYLFRPKCL